MNKTKFISLAAGFVLAITFTLSCDVQAAGQKDFYGVWVSKDRNVLVIGIRFCEINKDAITITAIGPSGSSNDDVFVEKSKFRIVKWEKDKDNNANVINAHTVYALSEDDRKAVFSFWMDAYSDLIINDGFSFGREAMKKSSTAELNKKVQDVKTAEETRIAAKEAEVLKAKEAISKGTFTDPRDKKTYKTVKIGTQTWMAENLNYDTKGSKCYDGGDLIETDIDNTTAPSAPTAPSPPRKLSNKEVLDNCKKYGRLYNWNEAMKTCPKGWHLPSDKEWQTLLDFAGGDKAAGEKLKAKSGWEDDEGKSGNGTDVYGFSALPGGYKGSSQLYDIGDRGYWWGASEFNKDMAYTQVMYSAGEDAPRGGNLKYYLHSVRCVKDY